MKRKLIIIFIWLLIWQGVSLMVHNPVIYQAYAAETKQAYTEFAREVTEAAIDFVGNTINIEGDEVVGLDEQMPMEEV